MRKTALSLVLAGGIGLLSTSCAKKTVDDQALTTAIQSKLFASEKARQGNVSVAVKDGVVTLTGDVPSNDVEIEATKIANGTEGVRSVQDQLKVAAAITPPTPTTAPEPIPSPAAQSVAKAPITPKPIPAPAESGPSSSDVASKPAKAAAAVAKPVVPETVTIPAGTRIAVRTGDTIDSSKATEGQTFRGSLDSPLISRGRVVVPAGADVSLAIQGVKSAGRIKGNSSLSLQATSLQYRGKTYELATNVFADQGSARGKNTAIKTGIGAAAGALIGGLAGGGKGAGIGAAAGGGAGFGWNALTKGQQVKIPAETVLNFRLEQPLSLPVSRRTEE